MIRGIEPAPRADTTCILSHQYLRRHNATLSWSKVHLTPSEYLAFRWGQIPTMPPGIEHVMFYYYQLAIFTTHKACFHILSHGVINPVHS